MQNTWFFETLFQSCKVALHNRQGKLDGIGVLLLESVEIGASHKLKSHNPNAETLKAGNTEIMAVKDSISGVEVAYMQTKWL